MEIKTKKFDHILKKVSEPLDDLDEVGIALNTRKDEIRVVLTFSRLEPEISQIYKKIEKDLQDEGYFVKILLRQSGKN